MVNVGHYMCPYLDVNSIMFMGNIGSNTFVKQEK